jgi:hypothetical protein
VTVSSFVTLDGVMQDSRSSLRWAAVSRSGRFATTTSSRPTSAGGRPILPGDGRRLLGDGPAPQSLTLIDTKTTPKGVTVLRYEVVADPRASLALAMEAPAGGEREYQALIGPAGDSLADLRETNPRLFGTLLERSVRGTARCPARSVAPTTRARGGAYAAVGSRLFSKASATEQGDSLRTMIESTLVSFGR